MEFHRINVHLKDEFQVLRIQEGAKRNEIQIIALEVLIKKIVIIGWNLETNSEVSMFQTSCSYEEHECADYVVGGMKSTSNFLVSDNFIFDLKTNLPFQAKARVEENPLNERLSYINQRKMYKDSSRYLCVEQPNLLCFSSNKRELTMWTNISDKQLTEQMIDANTDIEMYSRIFQNQSLFHHFSFNSEIIGVIEQKFCEMLGRGQCSD